jgi:hypothetical protein
MDEELGLSAATQAALTEFLAERDERQARFEGKQQQQQLDKEEEEEGEEGISIDAFAEDWQVWESLSRADVRSSRNSGMMMIPPTSWPTNYFVMSRKTP